MGKTATSTHFSLNTIAELPAALSYFRPWLGKYRIFSFTGEMGVGKTTIIKSLCTEMGVEDTPNSPSFAIVNEYVSPQWGHVYHFDFYRIKTIAEAFDMGFDSYLESGKYCFIEWGEMVAQLLPINTVFVNIKRIENRETREITLSLSNAT